MLPWNVSFFHNRYIPWFIFFIASPWEKVWQNQSALVLDQNCFYLLRNELLDQNQKMQQTRNGALTGFIVILPFPEVIINPNSQTVQLAYTSWVAWAPKCFFIMLLKVSKCTLQCPFLPAGLLAVIRNWMEHLDTISLPCGCSAASWTLPPDGESDETLFESPSEKKCKVCMGPS